jgi:hypothetical protein
MMSPETAERHARRIVTGMFFACLVVSIVSLTYAAFEGWPRGGAPLWSTPVMTAFFGIQYWARRASR